MAEGGHNSDENNPFSFKSFVVKKDKPPTSQEKTKSNEDLDIFAMPDMVQPKRREKTRQIVVVDESKEGKNLTLFPAKISSRKIIHSK